MSTLGTCFSEPSAPLSCCSASAGGRLRRERPRTPRRGVIADHFPFRRARRFSAVAPSPTRYGPSMIHFRLLAVSLFAIVLAGTAACRTPAVAPDLTRFEFERPQMGVRSASRSTRKPRRGPTRRRRRPSHASRPSTRPSAITRRTAKSRASRRPPAAGVPCRWRRICGTSSPRRKNSPRVPLVRSMSPCDRSCRSGDGHDDNARCHRSTASLPRAM